MVPESDNAKLAERLRKACTTQPNKIRLPTSIRFMIDGGLVRMHLAPSCVKANMQDDAASFEGWALAVKRWLPEIKQVELSWDFDGEEHLPHYQRFLFRVKEFESIFRSWFSIKSSNTPEFVKLRTDKTEPHIVHSPKKPRVTSAKDRCVDISEALTSEHKLECFIMDNPAYLSDLFGISRLDRQCPVGVFAGRVRAGNEIFPRGHSAIDLWGVSKDEADRKLFLFELKTTGNAPMGIMSEMFFYSYVMEAIQRGCFKLQKENKEITSTTSVCACILAPKWHPLIDKEVIRIANRAFAESGRTISFGIVRIDPDKPSIYTLET